MTRKKVQPALRSGLMQPEEIKEYVRFMGLTLKKFGLALGGVGPRTIGKYLRGEALIPTGVAERVRDLVYRRQPAASPDAPRAAPAPAPPPGRRKLRYVLELYEIG